jgi:hypothetical protein
MPKVRTAAGVQGTNVHWQVLTSSIMPTTTRLLLNGRAMLKVYYFTEWLRIVMLAVSAGLAVSWRARMAAGNASDVELRVAMAVLSMGVVYTKSVRDKWKLLERAMQQLSYGGAIVLLFDLRVGILKLWPKRGAATLLSIVVIPHGQPEDVGKMLVPVAPMWHCIDFVQGWSRIITEFDWEGPVSADDAYICEGVWLKQLQELVRRANKATLAENTKACFL